MLQKDAFSGFTLIEVLIALLVISIAMTAILTAINAQVSVIERLQNASAKRWVGMNVIASIQAGILPRDSAHLEGEEEIMNKTWYWKALPIDSGSSSILRFNVSVNSDKHAIDDNVAITGFVLLD